MFLNILRHREYTVEKIEYFISTKLIEYSNDFIFRSPGFVYCT